jgi:hypothetical protein
MPAKLLSQIRADSDKPLPVRIVMVYDDAPAGFNAMRLFRRIQTACREEAPAACQLWRFDVLGFGILREFTARAAAEADIVIIAASEPRWIPLEIGRWIASWTDYRVERPGALVGLFGEGENPDHDLAGLYLERVAEQAGMDLFLRSGAGVLEQAFNASRFRGRPRRDDPCRTEAATTC